MTPDSTLKTAARATAHVLNTVSIIWKSHLGALHDIFERCKNAGPTGRYPMNIHDDCNFLELF